MRLRPHLFIGGLSIILTATLAAGMRALDARWDHWQSARSQLFKNEDKLADMICIEDGFRLPPSSGFDPFASVRGIYRQPDFAEGDSYTGGLPVPLKKLTPLVPADLYQQLVSSVVQESLLQRNPDTMAWEPYIAEKWEVAPGGLSISFDLRPGVRFSDGEPLTSADVAYTFQKIQDPETDCPDLKALMDKVVSCRAEGPRRVVFRMSEPYFKSLEFTGGMPILAKHWYSRFTAAEFNAKPGLLFGSGPFMLAGQPESWTPGAGAVLVRNPWFWGPRPPLAKLTFREYQTNTAREVDFRNGIIDSFGISPDKFPQFEREIKETKDGSDPKSIARMAEFHRFTSLDDGYSYIGWNEQWEGKPSPFADKRVRQAMVLLIDRERILNDIFNGIGKVATGPFERSSAQSDNALKPWPYDPARARALLKEAGWEDRDGNGILEDASGREFRFRLSYGAGHEGSDRQMQFIRDGLRRGGVIMDTEPLDFPVLLTRLGSRDFQAVSLAWGGSVESDPRQIFHSVSINGGDNNIGYSNPKLDLLIDQARVEMDKPKRDAMWKECHRILHEDQPYAFLFTRETMSLINRRFKGVVEPKVGFYNYGYWYVPKELQKNK